MIFELRNLFLTRVAVALLVTASLPASGRDPFWAPASVVGLCGFGMTTMLAGLAIASNGPHWGVANAAVFPMAMAFGGTAQFVAGLIMLRRGEIFSGSAFLGFGAFWWAFTFLASGLLAASLGPTGPYDLMWFMIVWGMFAFSFAINAHYHGTAILFVFWSLVVAFVLLAVDFGLVGAGRSPASGLWEATGIVTFLSGAGAWYAATGALTAAHHGGKIVFPFTGSHVGRSHGEERLGRPVLAATSPEPSLAPPREAPRVG